MSENKEKQDKVDQELSELLDSALEDFKSEKKEEKNESSDKKEAVDNLEWTEDFIQQAASQFEANFANLLSGGDPNIQMTPELIQQKLQHVAEAAQQVINNPAQVTEGSSDIASSISQAIQGLNEGAEGLQNPFNEADLMNMFGNPQAGPNDILPFMQGMMQGLLSKAVLGPSLQEFVTKLPEYIETNLSTLDPADVERYEKQKKLMEEVLVELDKENDSDSAEVKRERFSKVLELMQKLQEYGQPPAELVGDVETPFNFDGQGNPDVNPECTVM